MPRDAVVLFSTPQGRQLITRHCRRIKLPVEDLRSMIDEVIEKSAMQRRRGLWDYFDSVLDTPEDDAESA